MATKREVVAQLSVEDLKLVANAADAGQKVILDLSAKERKSIKRAVKILRTVRAAK